jgi:hypothetical protein
MTAPCICRHGPRRVLGSTAGDRLLVQTSSGSAAAPVPRPRGIGVRMFTCLLFGSKGSGKTSMLRAFAGCKAPGEEGSGEVHKALRMLPPSKTQPATVRLQYMSLPDCALHCNSCNLQK